MSIENHPNFHAVNFMSMFFSSIEYCLRGKGETYKKEAMCFIAGSQSWKEQIMKLVEEIEEDVDCAVEFAEKKEKSNS
jgi:hypothetical protein